MNTLRSLDNSDLLSATFRLASEERRITLAVLEYFREIERRKAYSHLGYRSLFEYAVAHLRYSEASASRRIAAMHALKEHPELGAQIQSGEVTVTSVAKIQTTIRRDEKIFEEKWSSYDKKKAFQEMAALPMKDLEKRLVAVAPQAALSERIRPVGEELHEVRVYLSSDDLKLFEEWMGWVGHSLKNPGSSSDAFRRLIYLGRESFLKRHSRRDASPLAGEKPGLNKAQKNQSLSIKPIQSVQPTTRRTYIQTALRRAVFTRADLKCEYVFSNGERCSSGHLIQIEHRKPVARGGLNTLSNLEVLCRDHNQIRGIQSFGPDRMRRN